MARKEKPRRAKCSKCCPDVPAYWYKQYVCVNEDKEDEEPRFEWVWECANCRNRAPITHRHQERVATMAGEMTKTQLRLVKMFAERLPTCDISVYYERGEESRFEVKKFEVEVKYGGSVFILSEVGKKGDEGTYGEIYGRYRRHVFVGPKGACKLLNPRRAFEYQGKKYPAETKVHGWRNCLRTLTNNH